MRGAPSPRLAETTLSAKPFLVVGALVLAAGAVAFLWIRATRTAHSHVSVNEAAAIATLWNLAACEEQFRSARIVDVDGDGRGEFGFFEEMTGAAGPRTSAEGGSRGTPLECPLLSPAMAPRPGNVPVEKAGYLFRVWLPGTPGEASSETGAGLPFALPVDTDLAEEHWCACAWPATDASGARVFFVDESVEVWQTLGERVRHAGGEAPAWDAALPAGTPRSWEIRRRSDGPAANGNLWTRVR